MGATKNSRRERRRQIGKATGQCGYCPPHDGENRGRRQRPDQYKGRRKGKP